MGTREKRPFVIEELGEPPVVEGEGITVQQLPGVSADTSEKAHKLAAEHLEDGAIYRVVHAAPFEQLHKDTVIKSSRTRVEVPGAELA